MAWVTEGAVSPGMHFGRPGLESEKGLLKQLRWGDLRDPSKDGTFCVPFHPQHDLMGIHTVVATVQPDVQPAGHPGPRGAHPQLQDSGRKEDTVRRSSQRAKKASISHKMEACHFQSPIKQRRRRRRLVTELPQLRNHC